MLLPSALISSLLLTSKCLGFGVVVAPHRHHALIGTLVRHQPQFTSRNTGLSMTAESSSGESDSTEGSGSTTEDAPVNEITEEVEEKEEEKEEVEDPELTAIKEEIEALERTLKEKRRALRGTEDKADEYTKSGYARKVAEMENMRRARSMVASSNKKGAVASTLTEFLSVYDKLEELNADYSEDEFGKQYGALWTSMKKAYIDLGTTEYSAAPGESIDASRMTVLDSEHSEEQPVDTVLRPLRSGMVLQGNMVRLAEVVASLGAEAKEEDVEQTESAEQSDDESTE